MATLSPFFMSYPLLGREEFWFYHFSSVIQDFPVWAYEVYLEKKPSEEPFHFQNHSHAEKWIVLELGAWIHGN